MASATTAEPAAATRNYNLDEISNAVDAEDDASFQRSTFALKRTRSMGVLDQFVVRPQTEMVGTMNDYPHLAQAQQSSTPTPGKSAPTASDSTEINISAAPVSTADSIAYTSSPQEIFEDPFTTQAESQPTDSPAYSKHASSSESISSSSSLTTTPDLNAVHDDSVLQYEPSRHVDYLSHDWKESDISACWRNIVSRRRDVTNAARLENASWRTWTKAKYNLRTISPESVNWLKDCDITWLYGPLYNQPVNVYYNSASKDDSAVKEKAPEVPGHRPILKKRTVSDKIFARQAGPSKSPETIARTEPPKPEPTKQEPQPSSIAPTNPSNLKYGGEVSTYLRHHKYRHRPHTGPSDEHLSKQINLQYRHLPGHLQNLKLAKPGAVSLFSLDSSKTSSSVSVASNHSVPPVRHIHFNDRVEQCIAIDRDYSDSEESGSGSDSDSDSDNEGGLSMGGNGRTWNRHGARQEASSSEDDSDSEEGEDEPGLFLMLRSSSSTSLHHPDTLSGFTSAKSTSPAVPHTIELLPATTLKCPYDETESQEREAEEANGVAYAMSHNTQSRKHLFRSYDYNSVYESPIQSPNHSPSSSLNSSGVRSSLLPAAPSDVLNDIPSSVAMPSHLCAQLSDGEVFLPPVAGPDEPQSMHVEQADAPLVSSPSSSSTQVTDSVAEGKFEQSSSSLLSKRSSSSASLRDLVDESNASSKMATTASNFARGLLPSWKK